MISFAPFTWFARLRLRWKLVFSIVAMVICVAAFFFMYVPARIEEFAVQALKDKGRVVTAMTAANVAAALVFDDTVQINKELLTGQLSRDVVYVVVVDAGKRLKGSWQMAQAVEAAYLSTPSAGDLFENAVFRVSAPILHGGRVIGMVYMGFSNVQVIQSESETRARTLIVTMVLLLIGVAAVVGVTSVATGQLRKVVDTARDVASGNLRCRVSVESQDDVGELGDAFNVMLDRLESSQQELAEANRDLEVRVALRTRDLAAEIEEHRQTEASLRLGEQRFRQVIDLVPHFIFAKDVTGRFILANAAFASANNTTVDSLLGKTDATIAFSPQLAERFQQEDQEVIASGIPKVILEGLETFPDGSRHIMQTTKIPFTFSGTDKPAVLGVSMDVTTLKQYQEKLQALLRDKDVMLKEIHHRVKNNLQVISSLLSLQAGSISDQRLSDLMLESQNRIRSMAYVHERLYRSGNLATIDFKDYLDNVVFQLIRSYNKPGISCVVTAGPETLSVDDAIPCGLIINELISNSLKHAFRNDSTGVVEVQFRSVEENAFEIVVRDDGIGFPEGQDFSSMTSMGMTLVNSLVDQLDGSIVLERDHGTVFRLRFPKRT